MALFLDNTESLLVYCNPAIFRTNAHYEVVSPLMTAVAGNTRKSIVKWLVYFPRGHALFLMQRTILVDIFERCVKDESFVFLQLLLRRTHQLYCKHQAPYCSQAQTSVYQMSLKAPFSGLVEEAQEWHFQDNDRPEVRESMQQGENWSMWSPLSYPQVHDKSLTVFIN